MKFASPLFLAAAMLARGVDACSGGGSGVTISGTTMTCWSSNQCRQSQISGCSTVICSGYDSCAEATINDAESVVCSGGSSCPDVTFNNVDRVECSGPNDACRFFKKDPKCTNCINDGCWRFDTLGGDTVPRDTDGEHNVPGEYGDCGPAPMDVSKFNLKKPTITQPDAKTISVSFASGAGSDGNGPTGQYITAGACPEGTSLPTISSANGITKTAPTFVAGTMSYTFEIDLNQGGLNLDADGKIQLCVTHTFKKSGIVVNFQQTDVVLTYNLASSTITSFTFGTAKTSPDALDEDLSTVDITSTADLIYPNGQTSLTQGQVMGFKICTDSSSAAAPFFKVTKLLNVRASVTGGSPQVFTDGSGGVTDSDFVSLSSDDDCTTIQFLLGATFFASNTPAIGVTGTAVLSEKTTTRRLRLEEARALQTRVTLDDFEAVVQLTVDEASDAYTATLTHFALIGAAGAALVL